MINSIYIYSFFVLIAACSLVYLFYYFRSDKSEISNKMVLKNLLESLDMELPEELKTLDSSSTDPQNFS